MTPPAAPDKPTRARPRRFRWLRRTLAVLFSILLLVAIFHRSIARTTVDRLARKFAADAGMDLSWRVSGTITGGIVLDDVRITGDGQALIPRLSLDHAEIAYDLAKVRHPGPAAMIESVSIGRLDAEVNLASRETSTQKEEPARHAAPPQVVLPRIEIKEINLTITAPGGVTRVERLALSLNPGGGGGKLTVHRLTVPGWETLSDVSADLEATASSLTLKDLSLWPEVLVRRLALDLSTLHTERVPVELQGSQGAATADLKMTVSNWSSDLALEGHLSLTNVSAATLQRWGVPDGGSAWQTGRAELEVAGPILRPAQVQADLKLTDAAAVASSKRIESHAAHIKLSGGRLQLLEMEAVQDGSTLTVSTDAALPAEWKHITHADGALTWKMAVPRIDALLPPDAGFQGNVSGQGIVSFADALITGLSGGVSGSGISVRGIPIEKADLKVRQRGDFLLLEKGVVRWNEQNTLTLSGSFGLKGDRPLQAQWQAVCEDLSTIPREARPPGDLWPAAGAVHSSGRLSSTLAALQSADWSAMDGEASVSAENVKLRGAVLQSLTLEAKAAQGNAALSELTIAFDPANRISASGTAQSGGSGDFEAKADVKLTALEALRPWVDAGLLPLVRSGSASLQWAGRGQWRSGEIEGEGTLTVKKLQMDNVPEAVTLDARITQRGKEAVVSGLDARAGPWRATGDLAWNGSRLEVNGFRGYAGEQTVVELDASLPLVKTGAGTGEAPLSATATVTSLDLTKLSAALGTRWPVTGVVDSTLTAKGTLSDPAVRLVLGAKQLAVRNGNAKAFDQSALKMETTLTGGRLVLDSSLLLKNTRPLSVRGRADLEIASLIENPQGFRRQGFEVQASLPASDLAFLSGVIPQLRSVAGTASLEGSLTGTVEHPSWKGALRADIPELRLKGDSLPTVKDLSLRIRAEGTRLVIEKAGVLLAGGRLEVTGNAALTSLDNPKLDLRLVAKEVLVVRDDNVSLRADATLTCQGNLRKAAVSGRVDFVRGRVFKEIEYLPLSLPDQLPPPPPPARLTKSGPPSLPAPFDQWTFDVAVKTRDPVRLLGNLAHGGVTASLALSGTGATPVLTGTLDLENGWAKLPYSRINFTKGRATFTREAPFDPSVELHGESLTGGRQVYLHVQGRALDPLIRFTSSPPLPEGEIATLLATGVVTDDLESSSDVAAGRAAFLVLSEAYRKLFRRTSRESDEPPRLSFEFSPFGSGRNGRNVSAIYEFNPHLRAIGRVAESGSFRGMLYYLIRFR